MKDKGNTCEDDCGLSLRSGQTWTRGDEGRQQEVEEEVEEGRVG